VGVFSNSTGQFKVNEFVQGLNDNLSVCLDVDKKLCNNSSDSIHNECNVISNVNCGLDDSFNDLMGDIMQKDTDFHNVLNHSVSDNVLNQQCVEFHNGINQGVDNNVVSISKACCDSSVCHHSSNLIRDTCVNHGSYIAGVFADDLGATLPPYSIAGNCDLEKGFDDELFCKQFSCCNCKNSCKELCFCDACLHDQVTESNKCVQFDDVIGLSPLLSLFIL
jgi:hypothetical protein